jgi:hypothetical protein
MINISVSVNYLSFDEEFFHLFHQLPDCIVETFDNYIFNGNEFLMTNDFISIVSSTNGSIKASSTNHTRSDGNGSQQMINSTLYFKSVSLQGSVFSLRSLLLHFMYTPLPFW